MAPPYVLHPSGDSCLNGLNTFGCNSILLLEDGSVWAFNRCAEKGGTNARYVKIQDNMLYCTNDLYPKEDTDYVKWFTTDFIRNQRRVLLTDTLLIDGTKWKFLRYDDYRITYAKLNPDGSFAEMNHIRKSFYATEEMIKLCSDPSQDMRTIERA